MNYCVKFGCIVLSLRLVACSAKETRTQPPQTLTSKAAPAPQPDPAQPTGEQVLAEQPKQVQEAVKHHQQGGAWPVYRTPRRELYPFDEG